MSAQNTLRWNARANTDAGPIIKLGTRSIGVLAVAFLIWSLVFPLSSAIITVGTVTSEGRNKLIQHQSGGRIQEILVEEGEVVIAGQPVLEFDPSRARADLEKISARHAALTALQSRLNAERRGQVTPLETTSPRAATETRKTPGVISLRGADRPIVKPTAINLRGTLGERLAVAKIRSDADQIADDIPDVADAELIESQQFAYRSGIALLNKEIEAFKSKAATLAQQKTGLLSRIASQEELLAMTRQDIARLQPLVSQGYVARNRLGDRRRTLLEMEGGIAVLRQDVAAFDNQIAEIEQQISRTRLAKSDAASKEYARIAAEILEIEGQRRAALDVVRSTIVRAPISGRITKLATTTNGGVVGGGDIIAEVVPTDAKLIVEARIMPADIDYVSVGQRADLAITAFNRNIEDTFDGVLTYVSPDSVKDEKSGEQYFQARLAIKATEGSSKLQDIQPGMQAEVYIHTGSRTFMTYLTKPLLDSFRRAFKEK